MVSVSCFTMQANGWLYGVGEIERKGFALTNCYRSIIIYLLPQYYF